MTCQLTMFRPSSRRGCLCFTIFCSTVFLMLWILVLQRNTLHKEAKPLARISKLFNQDASTVRDTPVERTFKTTEHREIKQLSEDTGYRTNQAPEAKVYKWKNGTWVRLHGFCNKANNLPTATLKTSAGFMKMYIHEIARDVWISAAIKKDGVWEGHLVNSMISQLKARPGDGVLDIGAQLGMFSLVAGMMGRHVVAVEPLFGNVLRICKSVEDNNMTQQFTILFTALSNVREIVYFNAPWDNMGGAHLKRVDNKQVSSTTDYDPHYVPAVLLDDVLPFIDFQKILIKIDVESHEYCAMQKGDNLFDKKDVQVIFMEWNFMKSSPDGDHLRKYLISKSMSPVEHSGKSLVDKSYQSWPYDIMWIKRESGS